MNTELVVSSRNPGKLVELQALLDGLGLIILSAADEGVPDVEETGETYLDNAVLKAAAAWECTGIASLGDDSGLSVDHLDGGPGVRSARFAGESVTYEDNNRLLLKRLDGVPDEGRGAAFVCTLALLVPNAWATPPPRGAGWRQVRHPLVPQGTTLYSIEGQVHGRITRAPSGEAGFGYDPLFFYPPLGRTFAELSPGEKNTVSHRGRALADLRRCLQSLGSSHPN